MTDPRNISPRTDAFLAVLGPYISALEHEALDCPFLVKGLNIRQRDLKMEDLMNYDLFLETDYERFDLTVAKEMMKQVEQRLIKHCFDEVDHPLLYTALALVLDTFGLSDFGWMYKVEGTRCSGDAHTSFANGVLNAFNLWVVLRLLPVGAWRAYHEGDDGLAGLRKEYEEIVKFLVSQLACLGFIVKSMVTPVLEDTTFCGRFYCQTSQGLRSYCDPARALSKFHVTLSDCTDMKGLLRAKAMSYYDTDGHVPLVGALCQGVLNATTGHRLSKGVIASTLKSRRHTNSHVFDFNGGVKNRIDEELRAAVCRRSGWDPAFQLAMESVYRSWAHFGVPSDFPKLPLDCNAVDGEDRVVHFDPETISRLF